jgi:hypothetical protein
MQNYILRISSGSGGKSSTPDEDDSIFNWMIFSKEHSNSYFPTVAESNGSVPETSYRLRACRMIKLVYAV